MLSTLRDRLSSLRDTKIIALLLLLGVLLTIVVLAAPPIQGVADSGEFLRAIHRFGLDHKTPLQAYHGWHYAFVDRVYRMASPPRTEADTILYASSDLPFIWLAVHLSRIFPGDHFDIRWMGFVHGGLYLLSVAIFVFALRVPRRKQQLMLTGGCLIVLLDASYLSFANSFYTEPAFFIGYLAFVGLAIRVMRRGMLDLLFLAFLTIAGLVASLSDFPTASLAPLLAVGTLWLAWKFSQRLPVRLAAVFCALAQLAAPVLCIKATPEKYLAAEKFNAVFLDILNHSSDPSRALDDLSINRDLLKYRNTDVWGIGVVTPELREKFYSRVSWAKIAGYHLTHPMYSAALLFEALTDGFTLTLPHHGHHEETSGYPPNSPATGLVLWTYIRRVFSPMGFTLVPLLFGASIWAALRQPAPDRKWIAAASLWQVAAACSQFASAVIGEGRADITKHLTGFNFCFDVLLLWVAYCLLRNGKRNEPNSRVRTENRLPAETVQREPDRTAATFGARSRTITPLRNLEQARIGIAGDPRCF